MSATEQLANFPSLKGKRVFVTGGGSGIGAAIVSALCEQGAVVAFVDIAKEASEALCQSIAASGLPAPLFRHCDLRDIAALQSIIAELAAQVGDFEVLVNNAANDERHKLEDVTLEYWDNRIAINQRPAFFAAGSGAGHEKEAGWFDHQFQFDQLAHFGWRVSGLYHGQGVGAGIDAWFGAGLGRAQYSRQYRHARLGHDAAADCFVAR